MKAPRKAKMMWLLKSQEPNELYWSSSLAGWTPDRQRATLFSDEQRAALGTARGEEWVAARAEEVRA